MPTEFDGRVRRTILQQKEALLQFMEQHPEISNESIGAHFNLYYRKEKWYEIAKILNKLPGIPKPTSIWQKAWQDWRYKTRKKKYSFTKLSSLEEQLITVSNNDTLPTPSYKDITNMKPSQIQESQENYDDHSWVVNENNPEIQIREIKHEPDEFIGDMLETHISEYPNTQSEMMPDVQIHNITSQPKPRKKSIIKKENVYYDRNSVKEIHRIAKCVEKTVEAVRRSVKTQEDSSAKIVFLMEQNSRTLQSLAESQMRQAEALERQVSLEESRNSVLKQITLAVHLKNCSLKKL